MCGICGYVSSNRISDEELILMRDTMVHRGPDDAGIWQKSHSTGYIGLAHRRLSIIDLSELGHQPMQSEDGHLSVVFNGEIYNFRELKKELIEFGYSFRSQCDTEVILYAYDKWQEQCFSKFNGMFAIAIWDRTEEKLILSRDRIGVKPLYYYFNPLIQELAFGSELKPIIAFPGFHKDINVDVLGIYLCNKYIASPNTIFKSTYKLEPGTYLVYKGNELTINRYWSIIDRKAELIQERYSDFDAAKNDLYSVLEDAVVKRMEADVPVGVFLSSGIDSALVAAIAQKNSNRPIRTFTIGFNEKERNEADSAKEIAGYLKTDHTEMYIGEEEILEMIDDLPQYFDEPFADSSQLPTMLVSKMTSQNVTVALSGDGGDELFCGYRLYDLVRIAQKTDVIGNMLYHMPGMGYLNRFFPAELRAVINNRATEYKTQLFADVFSEEAGRLLCEQKVNAKFEAERQLDEKNWQERRMLLDMMTYLPDEIMTKTDRASMKYSLEVRSPLLDYRVVESSLRMPHVYKFHGHEKKFMLKSLAYDMIPKDLLSTSKKGFGVPLAKWLRGPLKGEIEHYSSEQFVEGQGLFDPTGIRELISDQMRSDKIIYSSMLWSYYVFQRWWDEYIG